MKFKSAFFFRHFQLLFDYGDFFFTFAYNQFVQIKNWPELFAWQCTYEELPARSHHFCHHIDLLSTPSTFQTWIVQLHDC